MSIINNKLAVMFLLAGLLSVTLTTGGLVAPAFANEDFTTNLSGNEEVPPVDTDAEGEARLEVSGNEEEIRFHVEAEGLEDVVGGHLHLAERGEVGPVVVSLFGEESTNNGNLEVSGTIEENDLVSVLEGREDISNLVDHLEEEEIYINIHTEENPEGEIRGQFD